MNNDKITTIAGITASVCAGILTAGVVPAATVAYSAIVGIGTISGVIFAYFTNKPNPFKKPEESK